MRAWRAFKAYRGLSLQVFDSQAHSFELLPENDRALIPDVPIRLSHAAEAIEHNADIIERIAAISSITTPFIPEQLPLAILQQTVSDFPDVIDGMLGIVRDWSSFGEKDRMLTYDPIIHAVQHAADDAFASNVVKDRKLFCVLVPGASLGRLAWEIAHIGLTVQGVDSSFMHLLMCNYIMNGSALPEKPLHLYPFVHHTGMITTFDEQIKEVQFPDVDPRGLQYEGELSMVAGEFLEMYDEEQSWHCVVTCFTIENSHSIISYLRRIAKILKVGGVWINHGCLDFKYDESLSEPSVEITEEELELVVARCGLKVTRKETYRCKPPYVVNGMINEDYESCFMVAVRE